MADGELKVDHAAGNAPQPQPGQVIAPGGTQTPTPHEPVSPASAKQQASPPPAPKTSESANQPQPAQNISQNEAAKVNTPSPEVDNERSQADGAVSWTASEFIAHEKSAGWYFGVALCGAFVAGLVFLITRDYISVAVVLVGAFSLGVVGGKKPKQQQYLLDQKGLSAGQKHYDYSAFKSFAIVTEGAFSSVVFMPHKRFAPLTTIYYPPEDEHKIVDLLTLHLPLEEHKLDAIDHLMQRIRF